MVRKCTVPHCPSEEGRYQDRGVTFHKIPLHGDIRPKWMSLCRITDDKYNIKVIHICSRHFLKADFCNFKGKKYMLRQGVLPSVFPWNKLKREHLLRVSSSIIRKESERIATAKSGEASEINSETSNDLPITDEPKLEMKEEPLIPSDLKEEALNRSDLKEDALNLLDSKDEAFNLPDLKEESLDPSDSKEKEALNLSDLKEETSNLSDSKEDISNLSDLKEEALNLSDFKEQVLNVPDLQEQIQGSSSSSFTFTTATDDTLSNANNSTIEQRITSVQTSTGVLSISVNSRLEALACNNTWMSAKIVEVDYEEQEILIRFDKGLNENNEWISMYSSQIRSLPTASKKNVETYVVGEECLALWTDTRRFPARVTKVIDKDTYEVLFNDGYIKELKGHKLSKFNVKANISSAPLFDPVKGSKQDRRDKKRRLNVIELFRKRGKVDTVEETSSIAEAVDDSEVWLPQWENGRPVGTDSTIETAEGPKNSILVSDPTLPPEWKKHLVQKTLGTTAGKWETIMLSPDGHIFRNKADIKAYLDENVHLKFSEKIFNFNVYRRPGKGGRRVTYTTETSPALPTTPAPTSTITSTSVSGPSQLTVSSVPVTSTEVVPKIESQSNLKIPFIDDAYMCPIEGCGKSFRRVNLAQMHVKHYHPEFTKFLDCTPNVADLAYARTVGESLTKSPDRVSKPPVKPVQKNVTPKSSTSRGLNNSPSAQLESNPSVSNTQPSDTLTKQKDSEIIKLLSNRTPEETVPKFPLGLPTCMYPDIKLKDLLNKSEGVPKRDDINLKSMSTGMRSTGIKTLLPVVRSTEIKKELKIEEIASPESQSSTKSITNKPHKNLKRKRQTLEVTDIKKEKIESIKETVPAAEVLKEPTPNPDYIVEGGKVIKIVRMKQEEIINCTCGITEEDGLMIQCEVCLCWQHAYCNNIERENQVPEKYICYICQNPLRQRSSRKYYHDQDWLKTGTLPIGTYHCRDDETLKKRVEKLKKVHDLAGGLLELQHFLHSLDVKIKVAKTKNHPKLYLWSKPWEKQPLPEKEEIKDKYDDPKVGTDDISLLELATDCKTNLNSPAKSDSSSALLSMLKSKDDEFNSLSKLDFNSLVDMPISAPQPEAAIETADCEANLIEHITHVQSLLVERLKIIEEQVDAVDTETVSTEEEFADTCQTLQMLLKDLDTLRQLSTYL